MYNIETSRLGLREWKEEDLLPFIGMNKDPLVMEHFPKLSTEEETREMMQRIKLFMINKGFGLWAVEIKETAEFIGYVGLTIPRFEADFTPCVEIAWRLATRYWGNGYASEAAIACLNYGFNILNLQTILSFTSVLNIRSINVMKRIGMVYVKEFEHPLIEEGNRLRKHVLYVKRREGYGLFNIY